MFSPGVNEKKDQHFIAQWLVIATFHLQCPQQLINTDEIIACNFPRKIVVRRNLLRDIITYNQYEQKRWHAWATKKQVSLCELAQADLCLCCPVIHLTRNVHIKQITLLWLFGQPKICLKDSRTGPLGPVYEWQISCGTVQLLFATTWYYPDTRSVTVSAISTSQRTPACMTALSSLLRGHW